MEESRWYRRRWRRRRRCRGGRGRVGARGTASAHQSLQHSSNCRRSASATPPLAVAATAAQGEGSSAGRAWHSTLQASHPPSRRRGVGSLDAVSVSAAPTQVQHATHSVCRVPAPRGSNGDPSACGYGRGVPGCTRALLSCDPDACRGRPACIVAVSGTRAARPCAVPSVFATAT